MTSSREDLKKVEEQLTAIAPLHTGSDRTTVSTYHVGIAQPPSYQSEEDDYSADSDRTEGYLKAKSFQPRGAMELPLRYQEGHIIVQPDVRASVSCNVPSSSGRWNAKFFGSSIARGPMGAATGSMLLSYDIHPERIQGVAQMSVGDLSNIMGGSVIHTSTAWYGIGCFYYPQHQFAVQIQSEQRLRRCDLTLKFFFPYKSMLSQATVSLCSKPTSRLQMLAEVGYVKSRIHADLSVAPKLSNHRRFKLSWQCRSTGMRWDALWQQSIGSKTSPASLGVGVRHHSQKGLSWLLTWVRGDMVLKIPILIVNTPPNPWHYLTSLYISCLSYLIQECIADLWNLPELSDQRTNLSRQPSVAKARADAEKQKMLMEKQASSRRQTELEKQGLVITRAVYYALGGDAWDVTTQLQFWTTKSSLDLPALSKKNLLGFYDVSALALQQPLDSDNRHLPASKWWQFWRSSCEEKKNPASQVLLAVQYNYAGVSYEITIFDEQPLSLPSNKARVMRSEETTQR